MADRLIRISKDKADLVKNLVDERSSPFETYADVLVFAASLGYRRKKIMPLEEIAKKPEPIRPNIFTNRGYDTAINLLAISHTQNPKIVGSDEDSKNEKIKIFEEYANGGLEIIKDRLKGSVDYLDTILLLLISERNSSQIKDREFDLSDLLLKG
jgi:dnd system-associated protein 4